MTRRAGSQLRPRAYATIHWVCTVTVTLPVTTSTVPTSEIDLFILGSGFACARFQLRLFHDKYVTRTPDSSWKIPNTLSPVDDGTFDSVTATTG